MANINNEIDAIRNASNGQSVRNTIRNAIRKINTEGGDASKLGGHTLDEYVKADELVIRINLMKSLILKTDHLTGSGEMTNKSTGKKPADNDRVIDINYTGDSGYMVTTKGFYEFFGNVTNYPASQ